MTSLQNHIARLQQKHDVLETELHTEESRPGGGDEIHIKRIKLEKQGIRWAGYLGMGLLV